jgi:DNA-binding Lrp family transcriptional regulator
MEKKVLLIDDEASLRRSVAIGLMQSPLVASQEKEKIEAIYPALYFNDQVVNCDCTDGVYNIVLLMKGTSFADIEHNVRNNLRTLDGVLRIKEFPIITLFEA